MRPQQTKQKHHGQRLLLTMAFTLLGTLSLLAQEGNTPVELDTSGNTYCNPVDLPYMFQPDGAYRSAADPVIVLFHGYYWLFVSKNDGYYYAKDMVHWHHVKATGYPVEIFAPTVSVIHDRMYLTTGGTAGVFTTADPMSGSWTAVRPSDRSLADPATFLDDDGKLYLFDGCSDHDSLRVAELTPPGASGDAAFKPLTPPRNIVFSRTDQHGWEVPGDSDNLYRQHPWIEGSWVNKFKGKYYLQYAAPGTQYSTYGDGLYVADQPMGPYRYAPYSPFSFKPTGFITGAGHSSTFRDAKNHLWHVATMRISQRHMFERRIGIFPSAVLKDGMLVTNTYLGDYPHYNSAVSGKDNWRHPLTGWMLLSLFKPAEASSTLQDSAGKKFGVQQAFDEDIRSWWSAASGNKGEWIQVDLQHACDVNAIQLNFADQGVRLVNRFAGDGYSYRVQASGDGSHWQTVVDRRASPRDSPHDYIVLKKAVKARYIRVVNEHMVAGGLFSLYGLRVFGQAPVRQPGKVNDLKVQYNQLKGITDQRSATVSWQPAADADFYIVRYGIRPDRLFGNYQVYRSTACSIPALNTGTPYYFTVDAVNAHGISQGKKVVQTQPKTGKR